MSVLYVTGVPVLAEDVLFLSLLGTAPGDVCAVCDRCTCTYWRCSSQLMSVLCVTGVAVPTEVVHHSWCLGCVWQVYLYQVKMYITVDVCCVWQVYLYLLKMYLTVDVCVVCDRCTCTYWRCKSQLMSVLCVTGVPVPSEDVHHSWFLCCVTGVPVPTEDVHHSWCLLCVTGVPVPTEDVPHSWCLCCVWQVYLYLLKM